MNSNIVRPTIGQTVVSTAYAHRRVLYLTPGIKPPVKEGFRNNYTSNVRWKVWERCPKTVRGIYIGYRYVQDGESPWEDEVGYIFKPLRTHEVWLIVPNEHQNPIRVFPEDCVVAASSPFDL